MITNPRVLWQDAWRVARCHGPLDPTCFKGIDRLAAEAVNARSRSVVCQWLQQKERDLAKRVMRDATRPRQQLGEGTGNFAIRWAKLYGTKEDKR